MYSVHTAARGLSLARAAGSYPEWDNDGWAANEAVGANSLSVRHLRAHAERLRVAVNSTRPCREYVEGGDLQN